YFSLIISFFLLLKWFLLLVTYILPQKLAKKTVIYYIFLLFITYKTIIRHNNQSLAQLSKALSLD
ncbi:MAG: hypothetical protein VZQ55_05035, partial [Ruminococcus sp.]|nr:hypothetical protein [Ruminococcus sp.]